MRVVRAALFRLPSAASISATMSSQTEFQIESLPEIEYSRLLPPALQVHVGRIPLLSSGAETTPRSGDADVDYQARLLGSAKVEVVALVQTGASLSSDDFDDRITKRMSKAAGMPAITSARAIGLAIRVLGARRVALVTPFPIGC
jgi:maleate isomerase